MILILGKGHLGNYLAKSLPNAELWDGKDIADFSMPNKEFKAVINTVGKTDLKFCEENPIEAFRCNATAPLSVYQKIAENNKTKGRRTKLIHISSGCLWDGPYDSKGKPFGPNSPVSPACFYSWSKYAGEAMLLKENLGYNWLHILRPRQLYSGENSQRNTLVKLMKYEKLLDTPNSMTSCETVSKTIQAILEHGDSPRIMNVYELGIASPLLVGMMLNEAGLRAEPQILNKSDLDSWHKPKRVDTVLSDIHFERFVEPPLLEDELKRNIEILKKNA